jgi:UDP-sulfoquinovose synthase
MRILVLGGDGYLGWPTAMELQRSGHDVCVVDNYLRRRIAQETNSEALMETRVCLNAQIFLPKELG